MTTNKSSLLSADKDQHIFDIPHIRVLLIVLYTIIFIFCCIGNLAVVLVVTFHSGMRNMTKFLLGNLAFANLCVGIFCVHQSLTTYLYESWFYGDFMCRMHHFTQSLCHTASVLVLVAIAVDRYLVLLYPFKSRRMMTLRKLVANRKLPWKTSVCKPKGNYRNDTDVTFTTPIKCQGETGQMRHKDEALASMEPKTIATKRSSWPNCLAGPHLSTSSSGPVLNANNSPWKGEHVHGIHGTHNTVKVKRRSKTLTSLPRGHSTLRRLQSNATRTQLKQRIYAIRVLIVIDMTFPLLNLPFHVRKLCLNYLPSYDADSDVNHLLTPLTLLLMYTNCAICPILYAFLSKKFRQSFLDLVLKRRRRRGSAGQARSMP